MTYQGAVGYFSCSDNLLEKQSAAACARISKSVDKVQQLHEEMGAAKDIA
jgi:hypothetical protein